MGSKSLEKRPVYRSVMRQLDLLKAELAAKTADLEQRLTAQRAIIDDLEQRLAATDKPSAIEQHVTAMPPMPAVIMPAITTRPAVTARRPVTAKRSDQIGKDKTPTSAAPPGMTKAEFYAEQEARLKAHVDAMLKLDKPEPSR